MRHLGTVLCGLFLAACGTTTERVGERLDYLAQSHSSIQSVESFFLYHGYSIQKINNLGSNQQLVVKQSKTGCEVWLEFDQKMTLVKHKFLSDTPDRCTYEFRKSWRLQ